MFSGPVHSVNFPSNQNLDRIEKKEKEEEEKKKRQNQSDVYLVLSGLEILNYWPFHTGIYEQFL